jgi:hypothetical protein
MKKIQFQLSEQTLEALRAAATREGISASLLARMILHKHFNKLDADAESKSYTFETKDWREIEGYVDERKLGTVAVFAAQAMDRFMKQNALSPAQKRRVEERYGISPGCPF